MTASARSLMLCTYMNLREVTWNVLEGQNSSVAFRPAKCTRSTLVLANSEAIQNQRMHKQICRYVIGLHPALG